MEIRYITDPDGNGWILAVPEGLSPADVLNNNSRGIRLPWCLKVELLRTEGGRDYFKILEGPESGKKASIKLRSASESFLTKKNLHTGPGIVKLKKSTQQFWYGTSGPYSGFTQSSNPVPTGIHDLKIPDFPHQNYYPESSRYQQVWFQISYPHDRYLHLGTISHGCATIRPFIPDRARDARFRGRSDDELGLPAREQPLANWDRVCEYLMKARKGDGKHVGQIQVLA
jgi:hypothetical protein